MKLDRILFHCEHPKWIRTKSGEKMLVSCGKCKSCLVDKQRAKALPCSKQEELSKYCMFVTLTYSDDNVPMVCPNYTYSADGRQLVEYYDINDGELLDVVQYPHSLFKKILVKQDRNSCKTMKGLQDYLFVSDYTDCQKFIKRFRKNMSNIEKLKNEKFKYFAVSEYGPVSFRPHFHLLMFFDSELLFSRFSDIVHKSWKIGRIDFSLSRGGCSSYVASYVNSITDLPKVFRESCYKCKSSHSSLFGFEVDSESFQTLYKNEPGKIARIVRNRTKEGIVSTSAPWRAYQSYLFPKCLGYEYKSVPLRIETYAGLYALRRTYGVQRAVDYCNMIVRDYVNGHVPVEIARAFFVENPYTEFFGGLVMPSRDILLGRIYASFHYDSLIRKFCLSSPDELYHIIERYYNSKDYLNLVEFYQSFEFIDESYPDSDLLLGSFLYGTQYSEEDYVNVNGFMCDSEMLREWWFNSPYFQGIKRSREEAYNHSIKHKELNDMNNIFIV